MNQFRNQHWAVKLVLVVVAGAFLSPLWMAGAFISAAILGDQGAGIFTLGMLGFAAWFVFSKPAVPAEVGGEGEGPSRAPAPPRPGSPRFCESCGTRFSSVQLHCPECQQGWSSPEFANPVSEIARHLNLLVRDHEEGLLNSMSYHALLSAYEQRLARARAFAAPEAAPAEVRPAAAAFQRADVIAVPAPLEFAPEAPVLTAALEPAVATPAFVTETAALEPPSVPVPAAAIPQREPSPPGPTIGDMGRAVVGWAAERQADILLYVGAFMLSVAAIIFVAYRGEDVSGSLRFAILTAYALGFLTLGLLLHRWERVKEAGPAFLGLGAVLVPIDFVALRTQVLGQDQLPNDMLWLLGSGTCSVLYLSLALRGFGRLYYAPALPSVLVAWGSLGAVLNLPVPWFGPWYLALAAPGYVFALANLERWPSIKWLAIGSVVLAAPSVLWAHALAAGSGEDRFAVPAAYLMVTAAAATGLRWRRDNAPLALLPPLGTLTVATAWWAAVGLPYEWRGAFVAATAFGYLAIAHFRSERARAWAIPALATGTLGLAAAHAAQAYEAERSALPVTYAVALAAASGAFGRWRWAEAGVLLPPLAAILAISATWAAGGQNEEWYGAIAGIAALGYLALALFDRPERTAGWRYAAVACAPIGPLLAHPVFASDTDASRWALTAAYAPVLLGAAISAARWRFAWRVGPGALPPLIATVAVTAAWAQWDLQAEWYPSFAAATPLGYVALAWLDDRAWGQSWALFGLVAGGLGLAGGHSAVLQEDVSRWALVVPYGLNLVSVAAAFARWRFEWPGPAALLPPAAAMTALTFGWAQWDLRPEWYGSFAAGAAAGYLLLAWANPARDRAWQSAGLAAAVVGLALAHTLVAADESANHFALPVAYVIVLLSNAAAFSYWRFEWRLAAQTLPAVTSVAVLTFAWAQWDVPEAWYGAFVAPASFGYIALALFDERARFKEWLALGAVALTIGAAYAHALQFQPEAEHAALPVVYGIALAALAFVVGYWRLQAREAVAVLPSAAAAFGASALWAWFEMPLEWLTAWAAVAAAGYLVPAFLDRQFRIEWRGVSLLIGGMAIASAHLVAIQPDPVRWQLPVVYGVLLAAWAWHAIQLRDESGLAPPALAAMFGGTAIWAAGGAPAYWPYPALAIAAAIMLTAPFWERQPFLAKAGWAYSVALAAGGTLVFLPVHYTQPAHGLLAQLASAALMLLAAVRSGGNVQRLWQPVLTPLASRGERLALIQAAFAFVFAAAGSFNGVMELTLADRAWSVAAVGFVGWVLVATPIRRTDALYTFGPVGLVGMTVASVIAMDDYQTLTLILGAATAGPLIAYFGERRWMLFGVSNTFLFLAIAAGWRWADIDMAYLPVGFAAAALLEWAAFTTLRKYTTSDEPDLVVTYLSWAPWLAAAVVGGILLARRGGTLDSGDSLATTREWTLFAVVLAMASAAVTAEGLRLWRRPVWSGGSVGILGAVLMASAAFQPENVQFYTAPIGIYLILMGLTYRTSPELYRHHLYAHEAAMLLGALFLVLPPAEQSFAPGGGKFGLELLGIGLAMLVFGLLLHARWLVTAAVLTLSATAMRMVTGGLFSTPYWLLLGVAGTALISFGFLVLLERERWDRFRRRVMEWWSSAVPPATPRGPGPGPGPGIAPQTR